MNADSSRRDLNADENDQKATRKIKAKTKVPTIGKWAPTSFKWKNFDLFNFFSKGFAMNVNT